MPWLLLSDMIMSEMSQILAMLCVYHTCLKLPFANEQILAHVKYGHINTIAAKYL